jgi:hypothetical protein
VSLGGEVGGLQPASTIIVRKGKHITLEGMLEPVGDRRSPIDLLLSAKHCRELNIDINQAVRSLRHEKVVYMDTDEEKRADIRRWNMFYRTNTRPEYSACASAKPRQRKTCDRRHNKHIAHLQKLTCRLAERVMVEYLAATGGTSRQPKQVSPSDVKIGKHLTQQQCKQVRQLILQYKDVFMASPDDIPPPLNTIPPIKWYLVDNAKPVHCRKPNWGPAQTKFLRDWKNDMSNFSFSIVEVSFF